MKPDSDASVSSGAPDVTEFRQREAELRKLNRVLKALRDINHAAMTAEDEPEFLNAACRIIVEACGHKMAWIGFAEADQAKTVRPVASAGFEAGYLETLKITWADTERGRGPTGTAIRTGRPATCRNMLTDPAFAPWRAEALKRGYASSIVVPLLEGGKAFGAINIYSPEPDPFSEEETRLLVELAGDLAHGINALRARAARERAEEALQKAHDDLEQKVAERTADLAAKNEQLAQAQKMEAVGRLAGGVAHDFNNLMTVVTGFGRRVLRDGALASGHRAAVEQMIQAGERAVNLTRQLLAFSRKQIISPVVLDLNETVQEMRKMMPTLLGENIEATLDLQAGLWPVLADSTQITQVLMNLGANARDAMPTGGLLTIRTANVQAPSADGRVHADIPEGRYALLAVSDAGVGMSEETREHLFEPFFTTKERGAGTGLGLSSVYGIVQQSGGHIRVDTAPGRGATFSIYFPVSGAEDRSAPLPRASTGQKARAPDGSETILLVEDEAGICDLLAADLRDFGYQVLPGRTVGEALQAMEAHQGPIDLLLTDVILPGMSGPTLAKTLQARGKVRHVLFMSGHTEKYIAQHGVLEAGVEFIGKPFTTEALVQKIRGLLDGQTARQ